MKPLYRADHIGSFLRPSNLLEARTNGSRDELRALEDQQIRRILAMQEELGFELATDGEFRRRNFMSDFTDAVEGFDLADAVGRTWNSGQAGAGPVSSVTGIVTQKLRQVRSLTSLELPFLKAHSPPSQSHTISSHCIQARGDRPGLPGSFGPALGRRRDHEIGLVATVLRRVGVHPDRRATLQLLFGPKVAFLDTNRARNRPGRCAR